MPLSVDKERFLDASDRDEQGYYEYYYSGFLYTFRRDGVELVARSYDDEPGHVYFLRCKGFRLAPIPYDDEFFRSVVDHLLRVEGIRHVKVLTGGEPAYQLVDLARIA